MRYAEVYPLPCTLFPYGGEVRAPEFRQRIIELVRKGDCRHRDHRRFTRQGCSSEGEGGPAERCARTGKDR